MGGGARSEPNPVACAPPVNKKSSTHGPGLLVAGRRRHVRIVRVTRLMLLVGQFASDPRIGIVLILLLLALLLVLPAPDPVALRDPRLTALPRVLVHGLHPRMTTHPQENVQVKTPVPGRQASLAFARNQ